MQNQKNSIGLQIFKSFCNEQKQTYFHKMNDDILSHVYSYLTYDNINDINVYYDKLVFKKGEKKVVPVEPKREPKAKGKTSRRQKGKRKK